ncbi:receptor-like protein EIX2 [Dioscorea cayenensis subsp. rotundata]|uniref:Receptor-like protein EIX2 n=1 Tax=Dioscorea cayennensis subsp. rotundata TaxID=55577 RepID=A0AB40AN05_DIOCR|nr:receptor-like protein EIX2 [Dioscorea cayenensis subsp. rotundata]
MINSKCLEIERQTLLQFKSGLSDPAHRLSSWIGDDCYSWVGITCSNDITKHVVKLDLQNVVILQSYYISSFYTSCDINKALGGKLDPTLVNLQQLHFLDLSCNYFNGIHIPEFMGSFQKLEYLSLSQAGFIGIIPHQFGNLSALKFLDLSYNYIHGNFLIIDNAGWLSGLTSLKYLNLSYVDMSHASNWLSAINMLPSLLDIHLSECGLHFPTLNLQYLNFTSLSTLDLSANSINSTLPNWLFNVSNLEYLYLGDNEFKGKIPSNIQKLDISQSSLLVL